MARVRTATQAGITADWADAAAMKEFIGTAWAQFREGGVPATTGDIGPYTRRATTHQLAGLLDQVQLQAPDQV